MHRRRLHCEIWMASAPTRESTIEVSRCRSSAVIHRGVVGPFANNHLERGIAQPGLLHRGTQQHVVIGSRGNLDDNPTRWLNGPVAVVRTTATGQRADIARAAAVEPTRPAWKWWMPIAPTHTMDAAADARINDSVGGPWTISVSIFTGWPVPSIAVNARRTADSATANSRATTSGPSPWTLSSSIAYRRRSGTSRLTRLINRPERGRYRRLGAVYTDDDWPRCS